MTETDRKRADAVVEEKQFTTFERLSLALSFTEKCEELPKAGFVWLNAPYGLARRLRDKVIETNLTELLAKDGVQTIGAALNRVRELVAMDNLESLSELDKNLILRIESQEFDCATVEDYVYETMCSQIGHAMPELRTLLESFADAVKWPFRKLTEIGASHVDEQSLAYRASFADELRVMANHSILTKMLSRTDLPIAPEHAIQAADTCTRWAVSSESRFVMYWRLALVHAIFTEDLRILERHALTLTFVKEWFLNLRGKPKYLQLENNHKLPLIEASEKDVATFTLKRLEQKMLRPTKPQYQELIRESRIESSQDPNVEDELDEKTNEELRTIAIKELSKAIARSRS